MSFFFRVPTSGSDTEMKETQIYDTNKKHSFSSNTVSLAPPVTDTNAKHTSLSNAASLASSLTNTNAKRKYPSYAVSSAPSVSKNGGETYDNSAMNLVDEEPLKTQF
ncbi:unnamed protein product [Rotaria sp. Silwood2]|nr:unnamed protein product [Rotaria sp. Silwood2]